MNNLQLIDYILLRFKAGLFVDDIAVQLRSSSWLQADI